MKIKRLFGLVLLFVVTVVLFSMAVKNVEVNATASTESPVELRGVWVATVSNIDISKQTGTSDSQKEGYKEKLLSIIDRCEYYGINAIFYQIRPANDAFYESAYNPWSEFLVGKSVDPGWNVLEWLIDECHSRGIQVHAWLNPYRVSANNIIDLGKMSQEEVDAKKLSFRNQAKYAQGDTPIDNPVFNGTDEEYLGAVVAGKEGKLILNPSRDTTINHINNTIREIIENYEVDGIHFDDYFYPSGGIEQGVEQADYNAYVQGGGTLNIKDWRRDNVNRMVESVHNIVAAHNETSSHYVAFGISPAAVWAPSSERCSDSRGQDGGMNVICGSYSSYNDLYADTRLWVRNEWLDYILPQNYYNYGEEYREIASWWSREVLNTSVKLYIGTPLYRVSEFKDSELIKKQFDYINSTTLTKQNVDGFVLFSYRNLNSSDQYLSPADQKLYLAWERGALLPTYKQYDTNISMDDLNITIFKVGTNYFVKFNQLEDANGYVISVIKKTMDSIDFKNDSITAKVYNKTDDLRPLVYKIAESGPNINNFYLRVFDKNNNEVGYKRIEFENAQINQGATINAEYDNSKEYKVGETIHLSFSVESSSDLPITVTLYISHVADSFEEKYTLKKGTNGLYEYDYSPFMEGDLTMLLVASDGDVETEFDLGTFKCGETQVIPPTPSGNGSSSSNNSGCSFGVVSASILSFLSLAIIFIVKKEN